MEKNFTDCPHCVFLHKRKIIRPAVHGPLLSRSDGRTFHLYLEESGMQRWSAEPDSGTQIFGLFRYDLDPCSVRAESTLILIPDAGDDENRALAKLEEAADLLAGLLERAEVPPRLYTLIMGSLNPGPGLAGFAMNCAPVGKSA